MKILLATPELGYRGTPRVVACYARILGKDNEIAVWGYENGGDTAEKLNAEGFPVFIGANGEQSAKDFAPDIVNIHHSGVFSSKALEILKTFHSSGARCIETNVFGCVAPELFPYLDASIQISHWDLWQWRRLKGPLLPDIGAYCPNPVDTDSFKRVSEEEIALARKEWNIPDSAFIIGRAGKTDWRKLRLPLLKVLNEIENAFFVSAKDYNGETPPEIESHPKARFIERMKSDAALCRFYSACTVCVSMSDIGESFGLVNAEAMSCGTPVIALSTPLWGNAQVEMIVHGRGGLLLARPKDLYHAILRLAQNPDLAKQMSLATRGLIESRYSFAATGKLLGEIFNSAYRSYNPHKGADDQSANETHACIMSSLRRTDGKYPFGTIVAMRLRYSWAARIALNMIKRFL